MIRLEQSIWEQARRAVEMLYKGIKMKYYFLKERMIHVLLDLFSCGFLWSMSIDSIIILTNPFDSCESFVGIP